MLFMVKQSRTMAMQVFQNIYVICYLMRSQRRQLTYEELLKQFEDTVLQRNDNKEFKVRDCFEFKHMEGY